MHHHTYHITFTLSNDFNGIKLKRSIYTERVNSAKTIKNNEVKNGWMYGEGRKCLFRTQILIMVEAFANTWFECV